MSAAPSVGVLFVCLGNICRSPTAEGVFRAQVAEAGLSNRIHVDSCGTAAYHIGEPPDARAIQHAASQGYDLAQLRARQVGAADFASFDYILAMDGSNLAYLRRLQPKDYAGRLDLFLSFSDDLGFTEVPDPYYGDDDEFLAVIELVEYAGQGLLQAICRDRDW